MHKKRKKGKKGREEERKGPQAPAGSSLMAFIMRVQVIRCIYSRSVQLKYILTSGFYSKSVSN